MQLAMRKQQKQFGGQGERRKEETGRRPQVKGAESLFSIYFENLSLGHLALGAHAKSKSVRAALRARAAGRLHG